MATKHEKVLAYIENLPINSRLSVRSIAHNLSVSEGTAYSAIKEAENRRLVQTIDRVGTIRIEGFNQEQTKPVIIEELINLINGEVMGGSVGVNRPVKKFIIAAMDESSIRHYVEPNVLMIVGDREAVQRLGLTEQMPVIITGGFEPSDAVKRLADQKGIPIIGSAFDTFTTVNLINKALLERALNEKVLFIDDIYIPLNQVTYLRDTDTVAAYHHQNRLSSHSRYPVLDKSGRIKGIVTLKDIYGHEATTPITEVMTADPMVTKGNMSVSSIAQMMLWAHIDLMPVVDDHHHLVGVVTRQDVLETMSLGRQTVPNEYRMESMIARKVQWVSNEGEERARYHFYPDQFIADDNEKLSSSILMSMLSLTAEKFATSVLQLRAITQQVTFTYLKPVHLQALVEIDMRLVNTEGKEHQIAAEVRYGRVTVAKATMRLLELEEDEREERLDRHY
ncbi:MAG: DRTGG domain-containing protein [Aerococcus sp.]|nr:DRTGG domain-containing protein [Aerococcus sp.]